MCLPVPLLMIPSSLEKLIFKAKSTHVNATCTSSLARAQSNDMFGRWTTALGLAARRCPRSPALCQNSKTDTSKVARAGWTLAEYVWRLWYCSVDSPAHATSGRLQVPAPTKAPLRPGGGPQGACFHFGLCGPWARDCDRGVPAFGPQPCQAPPHLAAVSSPSAQGPTQLSQQVPMNIPAPRWKGGFTQVGVQTLYTAFSTGRTYDASGPPPYPCSKCGLMHWPWQGCSPPSASTSGPSGSRSPSLANNGAPGPHG